MNIVVLDAYTLNPGDLSWDGIGKYGNLVLHDRTPEEKIVERAKDAHIVFTNKTPLTRETLLQLKSTKYIGVLATGYNVVDVKAAKECGILVTNVPDYGTQAVAQHVFALLLEITSHVGHHNAEVKKGRWSASTDFSFWDFPLMELSGKTFGVFRVWTDRQSDRENRQCLRYEGTRLRSGKGRHRRIRREGVVG